MDKVPYTIGEIRSKLRIDADEPAFTALAGLGQRLKIPVPEAFLSIELLDKDGKNIPIPDVSGVLVPVLHQRSRSWTRNAYNHLFSQLASKNGDGTSFGGGYVNIKSTTSQVLYGAYSIHLGYVNSYPRSVEGTPWSSGYRGAAGSDITGIVIGGGTNAESFEDYALQTKIGNGTGAGQMSYVLSELIAMSYASESKTLLNAFQRYFNNNSGNSIDVNEIAIYAAGTTGNGGAYWCQSRDKLGSTITVPNSGQLKVTYSISLVYPA